MTTEIAKTSIESESSIYHSADSFEFAQRQAKSLCQSQLVPTQYQGQQGLSNCLVALEMSKRMHLSPLTVMQNLNIIHGKPSWSAQFIASTIMSCGRFSNFDYLVKGQGESLELLRICQETKLYPDYTPTIQDISLPPWMTNKKVTPQNYQEIELY